MENNNRSGHTGARAAPTSDALNMTKVEPTSHQLVFKDSTANGVVALKSSLPVRVPDCVLAESLPASRTFSSTFYSHILYMGKFSKIHTHVSPSSD
jgi:hypothetical protein